MSPATALVILGIPHKMPKYPTEAVNLRIGNLVGEDEPKECY